MIVSPVKRCSKELREQNKAYPRFCERCGLGPCGTERPKAEPRFSTEWEREDYEREQRGEAPLGPVGARRPPISGSLQPTVDTLVKLGKLVCLSRGLGGEEMSKLHNDPDIEGFVNGLIFLGLLK